MSDDTPRIDEIMAARIGRVLAGESTPEEEAVIAEWRESAPENEREYQALLRLWEATAPARAIAVPPVDEAWARMKSRVAEESGGKEGGADGGATTEPKWRPLAGPPRSKRHWTGLAVAIAAGVALLIGLPLLRPDPGETARWTVAAAAGETESVSLADGSTVRVGSGSSLSFPDRFDEDRRLVRLEGEAEFDVQPGERPFVIETAVSRVTVLGTRFTVHETGEATYLSVTEGRVRIESLADVSAATEVGAGEAVVLAGDLRSLDPSEADAVARWIEGGLAFASTPAGEVIDLLRRRTGWSITLGPTADPDARVTVDLDGLSIEECASVLAEVLGVAAELGPEGGWRIG